MSNARTRKPIPKTSRKVLRAPRVKRVHGTMITPPSIAWYASSVIMRIKGDRLTLLGTALKQWVADNAEQEKTLAAFVERHGRPWLVYHRDACTYTSTGIPDTCDCVPVVLYPGARA